MAVDFTQDMYRDLQKGLPEEFLRSFDQGLQHYFKANWGDAEQCLNEALKHKAEDGPTLQLMGVMKQYNMVPPESFSHADSNDNFHQLEGF